MKECLFTEITIYYQTIYYQQKRGIIKTLVDRANWNCEAQFLSTELNHLNWPYRQMAIPRMKSQEPSNRENNTDLKKKNSLPQIKYFCHTSKRSRTAWGNF